MWSSVRPPVTSIMLRISEWCIYIGLILHFYPCFHCNYYQEFLDSFFYKFYNLDRIMGPGGIPKIITFLSHLSHVIGKTNKKTY